MINVNYIHICIRSCIGINTLFKRYGVGEKHIKLVSKCCQQKWGVGQWVKVVKGHVF